MSGKPDETFTRVLIGRATTDALTNWTFTIPPNVKWYTSGATTTD